MIKYIIKDGVIKLIRHIITYTETSKTNTTTTKTTRAISIINDKELANIIYELDYKGIKYEIESFDVSEYESYEDIPCDSIKKADAIICPSFEEFKEKKISEISTECNNTIERGFDINIKDEVKHFSLSVQDQINMAVIMQQISSGIITDKVKYHADGELCEDFSIEEFISIVNKSIEFKTYHTTYCNYLMRYIESLTSRSQISTCFYGCSLTTELNNQFVEFLGEEIINKYINIIKNDTTNEK